jgi:hypothetical protein
MSTKDRRLPKSVPTSAPPEVSTIDASWDDDTRPGLDLDDPLNEFDRVTAIPELPSDYAKRVMASAEDSRAPDLASEPPVLTVQPMETAQFSLDSAPPPRNRSADSTAPRHALSAHAAETARPGAAARGALPTARVPAGAPHSPSPTGLELADLTLDSVSSIQLEPPRPAQPKGRDPRDPVLELELDGLSSGPLAAAAKEDPAITEMKDRYAMGDFTGALVIAEGILDSNPEDLEAPRYAQSCRDVLTQMYSARLGSLDQVARVAVPSDQIRWLTLDHRAGFLLSLIDGGSTVDQILDISGMTRLDALRIMYQLLDQRVISLGY